MPSCRSCGAFFPNRLVIDGVSHVLASRRHCLNCSPLGNRGPIPKIREQELRTCGRCGREYRYEKKKGHRIHICNSCNANKQRRDKKAKAVAYKGGSCFACGYSKCLNALEFHHPDPNFKEERLSGMMTLSWDRITKELDKCVLLCSNCHKELHAGYGS